jgi:hypothetical protein
MNEAETRVVEYLRDQMGAQQIKIKKSTPHQTEERYVVSGECVDKEGDKQDFEIEVGDYGTIVSKKITPARQHYTYKT